MAHEINNPTAVILGNMDVLVADLGSSRNRVQTEIDLIIEQVYRIRSITDRLLQYSRSDMPNDASRPSSLFRSDISPVPSDFDHFPVEPVHLEAVIKDIRGKMSHA